MEENMLECEMQLQAGHVHRHDLGKGLHGKGGLAFGLQGWFCA